MNTGLGQGYSFLQTLSLQTTPETGLLACVAKVTRLILNVVPCFSSSVLLDTSVFLCWVHGTLVFSSSLVGLNL